MRFRYFGFGLLAGAGGAAVYFRSRQRVAERQTISVRHKALKYGAPSPEKLRFFDDFVISFDTRTKSPEWVLEHITWTDKARVGDRQNVLFKEDESFEERFRSRLTDYRGSGYDRGHMAPAANHKLDQTAMDSTFLLTNVSPQVGTGFNRDYWARFERFVNQLTRSCKEVFIVTGPLYLPHKVGGVYEMRHSYIGEPPSLVSVPTHFFKVVLGERPDSDSLQDGTTLGAFVMPNAPIDPETPLTAFAVPLYQLEALSGLHFFPRLITTGKQAFHDQVALSWQRKGRQQLLDQQALRLESLLNPVKLFERPADPTAALRLFDGPVAGKEEGFLPTVPQELQPQAQAEAGNLADVHPETKPGAHLMHKDVCTAAPLLKADQPSSKLDVASAVDSPAVATQAGNQSLAQASAGPDSKVEVKVADKRHRLGAIQRRPLVVTEGISADGLMHICDHTKCVLPPPDWYLKKKALVNAAISGKELGAP